MPALANTKTLPSSTRNMAATLPKSLSSKVSPGKLNSYKSDYNDSTKLGRHGRASTIGQQPAYPFELKQSKSKKKKNTKSYLETIEKPIFLADKLDEMYKFEQMKIAKIRETIQYQKMSDIIS